MAFYAIATLLIGMVGDYLFQTKIAAETATTQDLAIQFAKAFEEGDAETLYQEAREAARTLGGRLLIVDMDGKVQVDTSSKLNGRRLAHPEVVSVLNGQASDYGFHKLEGSNIVKKRALFDFVRGGELADSWVGYFSAALVTPEWETIGLVMLSISVQDMVDDLRTMQDNMLLVFFAAALAVLVVSLVFSQVITKPIAALTEGIKRMARGDLSSRVKVSGKDEISRLGATFNQMSEKLENLDVSRNEFVSNASHELKTPLATMKIMLESMLYQEDMPAELRTEFLTDINKELDRLSNIVTDLLTLVQIDAREYQPMRSSTTLRELVEETVHRLEPLAREKEQNLKLTIQAAAPINVDKTKIQQVIYNLIDNAIKYTPIGGKIVVLVKQEGKNAVLEVSDNGSGIPKKDQAHIFDRFYRVDRARSRATGGNGLGLSIVHQAVMLHDGAVTVHSEEGKGSTFRVELPLAQ